RTDQLHAGVQDAARLGDTRRRPARRRAFAGTSRGHETSLRKRDGDHPIFAAGAPERVLFSLKPTYQGTHLIFLSDKCIWPLFMPVTTRRRSAARCASWHAAATISARLSPDDTGSPPLTGRRAVPPPRGSALLRARLPQGLAPPRAAGRGRSGCRRLP